MASKIPCQFPGCEFKATNNSEQIALAMFQSHLMSHSQPTPAPTNAQKLPPIPRPAVKQDISEEDWMSFLTEWNNFKRCTSIPANIVADQLYHCCEPSLARLIIREQPQIVSLGEDELLAAIKRLAVIKIATSVRRTNLLASKQSHGESAREFYANIKAAAATCDYRVKCMHACCADKDKVDYTSSVVKDVLIVGIADAEIQKDLLSWEELDKKDDKEVLAFVESKELAQTALNKAQTTGTAGVSAFRKLQKTTTDPAEQSLASKLALKGKCGKCNMEISLYKRYHNGKMNRTAFTLCRKCHQECQPTKSDNSGVSAETLTSAIEIFFIGDLDGHSTSGSTGQAASSVHAVTLDHHIFTSDGWQRASALAHPTLRLRMTTCEEDYQRFCMSFPAISPKYLDVVTDSGAQSALFPRETFLKSGFTLKDLIPVRHLMKSANTSPIAIDGEIFIRLSGTNSDGDQIEAAVMAYVSPDANHFYLSREAMIQLQIIDKSFPRVGCASQKQRHELAARLRQKQRYNIRSCAKSHAGGGN